MGSKKKRSKREQDPLAAYRRIRKEMPPPEKVIADKRRQIDDERARREIEDQRARRDIEDERARRDIEDERARRDIEGER